jgi:hypothetical protein
MTDAVERARAAQLSEEVVASIEGRLAAMREELAALRRTVAQHEATIVGLATGQRDHAQALEELEACRGLGKRGD